MAQRPFSLTAAARLCTRPGQFDHAFKARPLIGREKRTHHIQAMRRPRRDQLGVFTCPRHLSVIVTWKLGPKWKSTFHHLREHITPLGRPAPRIRPLGHPSERTREAVSRRRQKFFKIKSPGG